MERCWTTIADSAKGHKLKHRRLCCIKLLRNAAMQSLGQSVLTKFLLPRNQRFDDMAAWLQIDDLRFRRICCHFLRNLGFVASFSAQMAINNHFLLQTFRLILDPELAPKPKGRSDGIDVDALRSV